MNWTRYPDFFICEAPHRPDLQLIQLLSHSTMLFMAGESPGGALTQHVYVRSGIVNEYILNTLLGFNR